MGFMEPFVTGKEKWFEIDGNCGISFVPFDVPPIPSGVEDLTDEETLKDMVRDYYEGSEIWSVEIREGYGARMSAPGYMDCTEWTVFDTAVEAEKYLEENYAEDEEDEDEDTE